MKVQAKKIDFTVFMFLGLIIFSNDAAAPQLASIKTRWCGVKLRYTSIKTQFATTKINSYA